MASLLSPSCTRSALLCALLVIFLVRRRSVRLSHADATNGLVEPLLLSVSHDESAVALEPPAALALAEAEQVEEHNVREELSAIIERQPEDVATLLRGWLVER